MRKIIANIVLLFFVTNIIYAQIKFAVIENTAPYSYINEVGEPDGFF